MESFGLMDASGVGFYLLLPLYHCLHPFTVEMCACTFSIACKHGDWGYGQCKCTIWHSELEVHRARGNRGEERNRLPYITACRMSTAQKGRCLENSIYVQWMNMFICEDKICDCLCPRCIGMHCLIFIHSAGSVTPKIPPSEFTETECICVCNEELMWGEVSWDIVSLQ